MSNHPRFCYSKRWWEMAMLITATLMCKAQLITTTKNTPTKKFFYRLDDFTGDQTNNVKAVKTWKLNFIEGGTKHKPAEWLSTRNPQMNIYADVGLIAIVVRRSSLYVCFHRFNALLQRRVVSHYLLQLHLHREQTQTSVVTVTALGLNRPGSTGG